ncbi:aspartate 1-decarboxylase [Nocardia terpenica]|uniref:Aspartate 1-decarboxylase n=1 Tax=Nocardia terpenica TaxID=455432 RepID=A0A6G9Z986_9NOCA|nr:aspartate 1-decarboxylase [Nocardia terpenica]QIS22155.1 aspartate 1-decarboxylase [Nocardia terpenica]
MYRVMMTSKIHRATVTHCNLNYVGSVTIDSDLLRAANIREGEQVTIVDVTNGSRLETYAINGVAGSGVVAINGAAAHLVNPGDIVIIMSYGMYGEEELADYRPEVVFVDDRNTAVEVGFDAAHAPSGSGLTSPRGLRVSDA